MYRWTSFEHCRIHLRKCARNLALERRQPEPLSIVKVRWCGSFIWCSALSTDKSLFKRNADLDDELIYLFSFIYYYFPFVCDPYQFTNSLSHGIYKYKSNLIPTRQIQIDSIKKKTWNFPGWNNFLSVTKSIRKIFVSEPKPFNFIEISFT